jgi:large subunit ribosomal protein L23
MISADKVLKNMRLTEKASKLSSNYGQYTFEVYPSATKYTVREAVEATSRSPSRA